jgi:hypothetical protein
MDLIGSLSEQREREELLASNAKLRRREGALALALEAAGADLATSYVLEWTPDQGEDLYVVLVGPDRIVRLELVRNTGAAVMVEQVPLGEYRPETKPVRLRLAVALGLLRSTAA